VNRVRPLPVTAVAVLATAIGLGAITPSFASFASGADNPGNSITAASDFRPPQVAAVALGKVSGGAPGFVKPGGSYFVYANLAADTGNPASGIAAVTVNAANFTAGATATPLVAGSYSAGGVSYNYRSASLLADPALTQGSKGFTVTAADKALNSASLAGSATVDSTSPAGADVQTANAGTNGLAEAGDSLILSFGEPVEPASILAGWTGVAASVVVRINDNGLLGLPLGNDSVQVYNSGNSTLLPLGTIDLGRSDYVAGLLGGTVRFGASGTASTMSMSGNAVTILLGTYNATPILDPARTTAGGVGTATWTPVATPYDRAENATSTVTATESGAADREF
jgi:hypothetical protein